MPALGKMKSLMAYGLVPLLAGGLQACCFRTGDVDADGGVVAAGSAEPAASLEITAWGPRRTRAGVPFNVQPGGRAAIWIQVNRSLDGRTAMVQFDDAILDGDVSGHLVTAIVLDELYARHGTYAVRVIVREGTAYRSSNEVKFTVE